MSAPMSGYLWCAVAGLASAIATLCMKMSGQSATDWTIARAAWLGAAALTYAGGFAAYSFALQRLDMTLAHPIMTGVAMAVVAGLGFGALGEQFSATRATGMLLVALGALLLSR